MTAGSSSSAANSPRSRMSRNSDASFVCTLEISSPRRTGTRTFHPKSLLRSGSSSVMMIVSLVRKCRSRSAASLAFSSSSCMMRTYRLPWRGQRSPGSHSHRQQKSSCASSRSRCHGKTSPSSSLSSALIFARVSSYASQSG